MVHSTAGRSTMQRGFAGISLIVARSYTSAMILSPVTSSVAKIVVYTGWLLTLPNCSGCVLL